MMDARGIEEGPGRTRVVGRQRADDEGRGILSCFQRVEVDSAAR